MTPISTTPTDHPTLEVSEQAWGELAPQAAFVHVRLVASKLFSGRAALENAEELRKLVTALAARDIGSEAVALEGASLDVSTGLFTRSSAVTYRVRIHVRDVDRVPAVLDAIAACKEAKLSHVSWDYTGDSSTTTELLAACATRALAKARSIAAALDVTIESVHEVREHASSEAGPHVEPYATLGIPMMAKRARASSSVEQELVGLELAPRRQHGVAVRLVCRIRSRAR